MNIYIYVIIKHIKEINRHQQKDTPIHLLIKVD